MSKYVVLDLEMCKVPRGMRERYHWGCETIQIRAVLLDENLEIVEEFSTFVQPQFGSIDAEIEKLTGIRKIDVNHAPAMEDALKEFLSWIPDGTTLVSWSDNDEKQIRHEMEAKNICMEGMEALFENWIDCQKTFGEKMGVDRCYRLSEALIATDISCGGREHDGLVDAKNTALLFAKMQREPELKLNAYYQAAKEETESHLETSLGDLFAGLGFPVCA